MALILNIESSTNICSVSIARQGTILGLRESRDEKSHASLLTVYIKELLAECAIDPAGLDAVAVSKGPGSYTGLRIGVSVAKGIAYGAGIRFIGISTLQALASGVIHQFPDLRSDDNVLLCPMIDARRMEVYSALYNSDLILQKEISAEIILPGAFSEILENKTIWFFGNGSEKCNDIIRHSNAVFIKEIEPSARWLAGLSEKAFQIGQFENVAYFEPFYLKDFIATIPRKKILP